MCAEIVNLRQARKRKKREKSADTAAMKRVVFGQTKSEKEHEKLMRAKTDRDFEQGRREQNDQDHKI